MINNFISFKVLYGLSLMLTQNGKLFVSEFSFCWHFFKEIYVIDHTRETFKNWECTALEVELTNYGTDYFFKVTADEKEYTVKVFEGLPHTTLSTKYKGVEGEGCVEPEPPAEEEAAEEE